MWTALWATLRPLSTGSTTETTIHHGVAILATGARETKPSEYLYGQHAAVVTHLEMDDLFRQGGPANQTGPDVVFIQCVGSRNEARPLLLQGMLHPFHPKRPGAEKAQPRYNVYIPLPGHPNLRQKRIPVQGGADASRVRSLFPVRPGSPAGRHRWRQTCRGAIQRSDPRPSG